MASAVLANRTSEPNWASPSNPTHFQLPNRSGPKYMGKLPSLSNPNNPNPKYSKKRQLIQSLPVLEIDESPGGGLTHSAASDDASSVNRRPNNTNHNGDIISTGYVTFSVSSYTKKELIELKDRLVLELERIRQLKNRIDASDFHTTKKSGSNPTGKKNSSNLSGNKRSFPPSGPVAKDLKRGSVDNLSFIEKGSLLKKCGQVLSKLMKHKHGYIFNSPVDVVGLKLHDYYDIIKTPMDLGSVKTKLGKNFYTSSKEFAADVRLTFDNAMRYNPKGHDVFMLAEQFLARFEELYKPIKEKERLLELEEELEVDDEHVTEVEASSWDHVRSGDMEHVSKDQIGLKSDSTGLKPNWNHIQHQSMDTSNPNVGGAQLPVRTPSPSNRVPPVKPVKLPKPKAKDPNKRDMSLDEKHKLGMELQVLPPEKMEQVVSIIRKRNGHLRQDGDEIELDIEAVDTETLWELDRFVTNYKKAVSKMKRQGMMGLTMSTVAATSEITKDVPINERSELAPEVKKPKKGEAGDEDIDIGDEMPMSNFPPVEIEKDNGHASSSSSGSSSSSDDSSSSSDSDSGSSSGSDSEDAHS